MTKLTERIPKWITPGHRRALVELFRAKMKSVDHGSVQGIVWSLLNPAVTATIMYVAFRDHFGSRFSDYPLYLLIGVMTVNFFLTSTWHMIRSLDGHRNLLLSYPVMPETVAAAGFMVGGYKFLIELIIFWLLAVYRHGFNLPALFVLLTATVLFMIFVFSVGFFFSVVYLWAGDVEHIWSVVSRVLFFATPVFYSIGDLPAWSAPLVQYLNPLTVFVDAFRSVLGFETADPLGLLRCAAISLGAFFVVFLFFFRFEDAAVERI